MSVTSTRPDLHRRFLAGVQRGIARADQEEREDRANLRRLPQQSLVERQRQHWARVGPPRRRADV